MKQDKLFMDMYNNDDLYKKVLSEEETRELFIMMKNGKQEAKDKLIRHNIRIVLYEVMSKFRYTGYDYKDIVSIGNIGLIKAINLYDLNKNVHFFTYAKKCIDNEILYFLRENKKTLSNYSLEYVLNETDEGSVVTLEDCLLADTIIEVDYEKEEIERIVREVVENLPERKKQIIMLRYGFYDDVIYTQEEIGKGLNMSQSNVSKIIDVTLDEISKELYKRDIIYKIRNKSKYKFSYERGKKSKVKKN